MRKERSHITSGSNKLLKKLDLVVRFAGEGGQGVVTSAEGLAQAATQVGYHALTYATFPSQIMGGPTWTQTRVSTSEVHSAGDELDVLVAFNKEAYDAHASAVKEGGVVVYNSGEFTIEDDLKSFGMPFDELAKSTGNPRAANMVVIGAIAFLVNMPQQYLEEFVTKRFTRGRTNDQQIIESNITALSLGRDQAKDSGFNLGTLEDAQMPSVDQILVKGNEAICLGAVAAGLDFYIGYPISPATTVLVWMESNLVGPGKFVYQVSSEIEAITGILGASFAGKKAMTATAGPGFSLMSEGLGLGWMAEIPIVVVDVQRGGPATGLPTKTEQSDLFSCLHPAHGDVSLPIIAPGTVEECFYAAVDALNWAERYQGPVILMSEMAMAERAQNIPKPNLSKLHVESRKIYQGSNGYMRYEGPGVTPMPIPGGPGSYTANGSEHDPIGDTTHLPERHVQMTERRFNKLNLLKDGHYESDNPHETIAIMPWGGSKGPSQEAYQKLREKLPIGWYYTMYLNPLPTSLLEELRQKELVLVPELNYQGQWSSILRSQGVNAESITQYTGLPFKVSDLIDRIEDRINSYTERKVKA